MKFTPICTPQTERIFDIADVPFARVDEAEKHVYASTMKKAESYQGYKLRQYWVRTYHLC